MSLGFYFAGPEDSVIASQDKTFINQLLQVANGMPGLKVSKSPKYADVIVFDQRYQYRTWHHINELMQCDFVRRYANRITVLNHDSYARVFLPGLYTSLEQNQLPLIDAAAIPYKRDLWKVSPPNQFEFNPDKLFSFRGTFHTHPIRRKLCKILSPTGLGTCEELRKAFHDHDEHDQLKYIKDIHAARFSLCPRGLSPSSYRLYETMQLGRCPVIISDDWVAPVGPDWTSFTICIKESELKVLPALLSQNTDRAERCGQIAFETWQHYFSWPRRYRYFVEKLLEFVESRSTPKTFSELHDIWTSNRYRKNYGWTPFGRAKQLVSRKWHRLKDIDP